MTHAEQGWLMFRCTKTGEAFDSGFRFAPNELASVPLECKLNIRCKSSLALHEFKLADSWIDDAACLGSLRDA
jgi:hypothetical protein